MKFKWLSCRFRNAKVASTDSGTRILDSIRAMQDLRAFCLSLFTAQERQVAEERPKPSHDFGLQSGRTKYFRQFAIHVIIGFFKIVQDRTQCLSVQSEWLTKVNNMQSPAWFEYS